MIDLLTTFASQSALAMQNARLFHQLEIASQHKSTFLANMSHELRTPLNAIIGYSEMLQEDAVDEGAESLVPDLKRVNAAGKHLLELINSILDLSKIEAGKMELQLEDFNVARHGRGHRVRSSSLWPRRTATGSNWSAMRPPGRCTPISPRSARCCSTC